VSFIDSGARIDGKVLGQLVGSADELIGAIARYMDDDTLRSIEGAKCRDYVVQKHSLERVLPLYEQVLNEEFGT
jgi:hypothetical protein